MKLDWNENELKQLNSLLDLVKDVEVFSSKISKEKDEEVDEFLYLWIKEAEEVLKWSPSTIYGIVAAGEDMISKDGILKKATEEGIIKVVVKPANCDCSTVDDWCNTRYNRVDPDGPLLPYIEASCTQGGCTEVSSGCGTLFKKSCNGKCVIKGVY